MLPSHWYSHKPSLAVVFGNLTWMSSFWQGISGAPLTQCNHNVSASSFPYHTLGDLCVVRVHQRCSKICWIPIAAWSLDISSSLKWSFTGFYGVIWLLAYFKLWPCCCMWILKMWQVFSSLSHILVLARCAIQPYAWISEIWILHWQIPYWVWW